MGVDGQMMSLQDNRLRGWHCTALLYGGEKFRATRGWDIVAVEGYE